MKALVTKLCAIQTSKAASAVFLAFVASLHHKLRWNDKLHIKSLFVRHSNLAKQVYAVFIVGLPVHSMEALREAETEVRSSHCLEVGRA